MEIKRTEEEVDEQLTLASDWEDFGGTAYGGMSYKSGVRQAIAWMLGLDKGKPIEHGPED